MEQSLQTAAAAFTTDLPPVLVIELKLQILLSHCSTWPSAAIDATALSGRTAAGTDGVRFLEEFWIFGSPLSRTGSFSDSSPGHRAL